MDVGENIGDFWECCRNLHYLEGKDMVMHPILNIERKLFSVCCDSRVRKKDYIIFSENCKIFTLNTFPEKSLSPINLEFASGLFFSSFVWINT
jgi:hypothetical protein